MYIFVKLLSVSYLETINQTPTGEEYVMEQVFVFEDNDAYARKEWPSEVVDVLEMIRASSEDDLRTKVRDALGLGTEPEQVNHLCNSYFVPRYITALGQELDPEDAEHLRDLGPGLGVVVRKYYRGSRACYERIAHYHAPAGTALPNGNRVREGELVELLGSDHERAFFTNKKNLSQWKLMGENFQNSAEDF